MKLAYSIKSAAEAIEVSEWTIRKAIRTTDPQAWPPPLAAKRVGTGTGYGAKGYRIEADELIRWFRSWKDA